MQGEKTITAVHTKIVTRFTILSIVIMITDSLLLTHFVKPHKLAAGYTIDRLLLNGFTSSN